MPPFITNWLWCLAACCDCFNVLCVSNLLRCHCRPKSFRGCWSWWVFGQSLASAVAQGNVVRAICISKGKPHFWPPASPQTIHQMTMKIGMVDYVRGFNKRAKFHRATSRGFAPTHTWNITLMSFFIFFFFFFNIFWGSRTARTEKPIFMVDGSKRVFWFKEVPFGGLVENWTKLGAWQPKNAYF